MNSVLTLYTSNDHHLESQKLKEILVRGGFPFEERSVMETPESYCNLIKQVGKSVSVPGVLCGEQWVSANAKDLKYAVLRLYVNNVLSHGVVTSAAYHQKKFTEIEFCPSDYLMEKAGFGPPVVKNPSERRKYLVLQKSPNYRDLKALTTTHESSTLLSEPVFMDISLPNGTSRSVPSLILQLIKVADHRHYVKDGKTYYYMRGSDAIEIISELFFNNKARQDKDHIMAFARDLVELGVFHDS